MPELRLDPVTREWVIIASWRGSRPVSTGEEPPARERAEREPDCPFCPGNEEQTPQSVLVLPAGAAANQWQVRAFPNAYPALEPSPAAAPLPSSPLQVAVAGAGAHEVIVETPLHNRALPDRAESEVRLLVEAYHRRYQALTAQRETQHVVIFRNAGAWAGASLEHPHSQAVAMPVLPDSVRRRAEIARDHFERTRHCLYCDIAAGERASGSRVIAERGAFLAFAPFASAHAGETWLFPLDHQSSFGRVAVDALDDLGAILSDILGRIRRVFDGPDTNLVVHSAPRDHADAPCCHWYVQLAPRIVHLGGFEIGSGVFINTVPPEEAAAALRQAEP